VRFVCKVSVLAGALVFVASATAQGETVTVGSPLLASFGGALGSFPTGTWANTTLAEPGANVVSPVSGVIVRWRMTGSYSGGPFKLRVLRPAGGGQYTGAGTSGAVSPKGGTQTFTANLPIKAGDLIGLDVNEGFIGTAGVAGSHVVDWFPALAEGSTLAPPYFSNNSELGFNADVQPPPALTSISPASGSISGNTPVTITGHDLTGAGAVQFGSTAAASFNVSSDGTITAVAPPRPTPGAVDVTVTTVAGTTAASAADRFTYLACVVPKLKGKTLKAARKKLKKAECKLGKVKHPHGSGSTTVVKQSPKSGKVLAPGSKVSVRLGS
jgi:hypothetical protein